MAMDLLTGPMKRKKTGRESLTEFAAGLGALDEFGK